MPKFKLILPGEKLKERKLLVAEDPDLDLRVALDISEAADSLLLAKRNTDFGLFLLALRSADILSQQHLGQSGLLSLEKLKEYLRLVGLVPYSHQVECVRRVVDEMNGQAILADEVGLGKTIEAGLILREYLERGLLKKALILTPASLTRQWEWELRQKLGLRVYRQRTIYDWQNSHILIASLDTAKKEPHRSLVLEVDWDLVIVDEAHHLKNHKTKAYKFVSELKKRHLLLVTATPMQNNLRELFNLVQLIAPGSLGSLQDFSRRYGLPDSASLNAIRDNLRPFLIRTTKKEAMLELPPRNVEHHGCMQDEAENLLYTALSEYISTGLRAEKGKSLTLITLQKELCSSVFAALLTLEKLLNETADPIVGKLVELGTIVKMNAKTRYLLELLPQIEGKVVVFTEYLATQRFLAGELKKRRISFVTFNGTLSSSKKEFAKERFRRAAKVLLATESGGEGLNLQFCQNVINYDLPWNPMKLEQRIGRLHRLGQEKPVNVLNLFTADTIEEHILKLLYQKLRLFANVFSFDDECLGEDLTKYIVAEILGLDVGKERAFS
ncbi:MAG: DEAD/DEAH box helicase [Firmicutes bacterium]|nr:DEAD/DEAH box helicase [Bacillota bacterium]